MTQEDFFEIYSKWYVSLEIGLLRYIDTPDGKKIDLRSEEDYKLYRQLFISKSVKFIINEMASVAKKNKMDFKEYGTRVGLPFIRTLIHMMLAKSISTGQAKEVLDLVVKESLNR